MSNAHAEKIRRLRAARATGHVPEDLLTWLLDIVARETPAPACGVTPVDRLCLEVSAVVDRWITKRGASARSLGVSRRTLARCLKGENVTLATLADVADALGCDVTVDFTPREA